jgi:DNA repair exonuclease SbcCD ATPase subunit
MTRFRLISLCLLVSLLTVLAFAGDDEPIEKLIERANSGGDHKAELYAKVARREVELANQYFSGGEAEKAIAAVKAVSEYSDKALEAARQSHKKLKETEITLRQTSRRLNDVEETLAFEDRPVVKGVINHVEDVRTELLHLMFDPGVKS